jgi:hypothetical protein
MNTIWIQVLLVMVGGSMLKYVFMNPWAWVAIELAILGVAYYLLRRHPYVDVKSSMMFLSGLTIVNILVDLGIIGGLLGNVLVLAVLAWMFFNSNRPGGGDDWRRKQRHKWHK